MVSFSVCLWIKSNASPGVGTPFSYAVPGQANELVLIEWGNHPMEILINDKVRQACQRGGVAAEPAPMLRDRSGGAAQPEKVSATTEITKIPEQEAA